MKSVAHSSEALLPFEILLEHLQRQGFRIGVEHHLRLRALLAEFADNCAPSELKTLLCPLFATNAEQQESFYRAFDLYYPLLTGGRVGVDEKDRVETNVAAKELTPQAHRARRRAYLAVAAGTVVLSVGWLSWKMEPWWHRNPNQVVTSTPLPEASDGAPPTFSRSQQRPLVCEANSIAPDLAVSRSAESQSLPWGRIALIVTLLSWLAYELYLYRGHRLLIRRKRGQTPPYSWPIRADIAPDIYEPQELALVSQLLHRRYLGEAERLDVAATVEASVAALGFPTLRYRKDSRLPEYLFLIDRASVRDHQAHLYDHLATRLREQGLYLSAYFYEGDPRVCWDSAVNDVVSIEQLQRSYAGYRLVLLGNGEQLLDSMSGRLVPWHHVFSTWTDRAMLTPEPPAQWGLREMTLATKFAVAPATLEGLATLPAYFELASLIDPREWSERDGKDGTAPEKTIDAMRRYLGEDAFQWLCACAIYPELHWDLTLQIAALPSMAQGLVREENLVKLLRLEWFRNGSMPDSLRRELIARLDPRVQREVRQAIVGLLESSPPPTGTFAENAQRFQVAYQRYWANPRDRGAKRGLRTALNNLAPDEPIRDYASLDTSDSVISSPLQFVLSKRLRNRIYPTGVSPLWIRSAVRMILALLTIAAGLTALRVFDRQVTDVGSSAPRPAKYLAIMPFRAAGDDSSLDDTASEIVEALSAKLFQLKEVHLASSSAAARVNSKDPIAQIAQSLGVKLLVRGSVQGSGDRMAIVVSLYDACTDRRIWSQEFSGLKQDLLTVQDQIYSGLLSALDLKLSNVELAKSTAHFTKNVAAYALYSKGRSLLRSGQRDEKNLKDALELFNGATLKDPGFTLAYTGIADTCRYLYTLKKDGSWANRGLGAANRAQGLNDNLPEVHFALGSLYTATGKNAEAVSELKRALELAPNSDDGYLRLGRAYLNMGQKAEALDAFQHAIDANPYYWSNYNMLGVAHYKFGDNAAALKAFQRVTELDPHNPNGWSNIGLVTQHEGNWSEALPEFRKALELQPSVENYSNLGSAYFFLGKYEDALANFSKASEISPQQAVYVGFLADCYRRMGQAAKARQTYDRAISLTYQALQTNPRDAKSLDDLAVYYAKEGDTTRGLEFIRRAREIDASDVDLLYDEAVINTLANRMPEAFGSLQHALTGGYSPQAVLSDPELVPLRQRPEFQTMLQKFQP